MRFLLKAEWPVEAGNAAIMGGKLADKLRSISGEKEGELKPEAAYFLASNGKRTALLIVNMEDASQIPALANRGFWPSMRPWKSFPS